MTGEEIEQYVRALHIKSLVKYLRDEPPRKGIHVTDLVYGCPRYVRYVYEARESDGYERNLDETGMTRIVAGKLFDTIPLGKWHHVDLEMHGILGQIDDIVEMRGNLIVVDKKTIADVPPKEAHSHYVKQVEYYVAMLYYGKITGCEKGDVEALREAVKKAESAGGIWGAILYIDISASSKTRVSDVKVIGKWNREKAGAIVEEIAEIVGEAMENEWPKPRFSWFCQYCPIMNECFVRLEGEE